MGLIKELESESGAPAVYWRVIGVALDWLNKVGTVTLVGYISEQARRMDKKPLDARQLPIVGEAFEAFELDALNHTNPVRVAYDHVRTFVPAPGQANPFAGALDSEGGQ